MYLINLGLIPFIMLSAWSMGALYFKREDMSWLNAYKTFLEKVVNKFTPQKQSEVIYPVYIGIDEWGFPHADVIEDEFYPVLKNFVTSYFQNYKECPNRLEYYFFASDFKTNIDDGWNKIKYLRDIAERVVHQYIHKNYPSFGMIPNNLVALNLSGNTLFISIAKNTAGIVENNNYMDALRKNLKQNSLPQKTVNVDEELEKELQEMSDIDTDNN